MPILTIMDPNEKPQRVRLTEDYLDLQIGLGYPEGTILIRSPHGTGQYMPEGAKLGAGGCVAMFSLIADICEPLTD